jgi:CubicO group peptidase (beta-lactamase class C family)
VLGVRDVESKAPATTHTLYRIGSVTKTFTAETILALRDAGVLHLDEPAERWLPELAQVEYPFADAPRITLRHLLTHTSGLPRLGAFDYTRTDRDVTEAEVLAAVTKTKLSSAPGTTYVYSNFGMGLAGLIAARAARTSLPVAIRRALLVPLAMNETTFDPATLPGAELATGYGKSSDPKPEKPWRLGASEGAGGLWSSLEDMSRWIALQLEAWPPRAEPDKGPLARATLRESHVAAFPLPLSASLEEGHVKADSAGVAFAWHTHATCPYELLVEHNGGIDGFRSSVGFAPERGFGFVVLVNASDGGASRLRELLFQEVAASDALRPRVAQPAPELKDLLTRWAASTKTCDASTYETLFTSAFRSAVPRAKYDAFCAEYSKLHGGCALDKTISLDDPRAGQFLLRCERGTIELRANAVYEDGVARFHTFGVDSGGLAVSKEMTKTASELLALLQKWDSARYKSLFARTDHEAVLEAAFAKVRAQSGACKLGKETTTIVGDGVQSARVPVTCERGTPSDLEWATNAAGKVESVYLRNHIEPGKAPARCADR